MKLTVFTPTYNRAYIIENLYRSLQRQTCTDFEWLVVDDGSADNTGDLFAQWQQEDNPFPIRYYYKENGGKCQAINYALDLAQGELFFTVDSDDYLTDDAIEKIVYWESTITDKEKYCGLMGQRGTSPTETPNRRLGVPFRDGKAFERYEEYAGDVIDGERADVWYTSVHRQFKYPKFSGENFMTEAIAWNRMAHAGYLIRFFDDIIWVCKYLEDGLTKAGFRLFENNPHGYALFLMEKTRFITPSKRAMFRCRYSIYCDLRKKYSNRELADILQISTAKVGMFAAIYRMKHLLKG